MDLDEAGQHFARALVVLGIATIQALLLRGPIKAARARYAAPARVGAPPPPGTPPTTTSEPTLPNNALGSTDAYGNIKVSLQQSAASAKETLLHELVHRFFSPRFALLRRFRAQLNIDAYARSWLMRYLEETMAEGFAQLRANGVLASFKAIYFRITEGYVTLSQVVTEGNVIGTLTLAGRRIYVIVSTARFRRMHSNQPRFRAARLDSTTDPRETPAASCQSPNYRNGCCQQGRPQWKRPKV